MVVKRSAKEGASPQAIPDKLYFKIGEVAKIAGVKPYVLRYWETEFSELKPNKSKTKQRLYRRKEVEAVLKIRELLHERRFTIEGARQHLKDLGKSEKKQQQEKQITLPLQNSKAFKENLKTLQKKLQELTAVYAH